MDNTEEIAINIDSVEDEDPPLPRSTTNSNLLDQDCFFLRSSSSRRGSTRSLTSVDSSIVKSRLEFQLPSIPEDLEDLFKYVKDLGDNFKKTSYLKEILNLSWIKDDPNAECSGFSLLLAGAKLGENKLVSALANFDQVDLDLQDPDGGNTAMHFCAQVNNYHLIETLIKHGSKSVSAQNKFGLSPVQVAALTCHLESLETFFKYDTQADQLILTENNETLLHLACKGALSKALLIKDGLTSHLEGASVQDDSSVKQLEDQVKLQEAQFLQGVYPCLHFLLDLFKKNPDYLELEDKLPTSPGLILHYFICLNFIQGVKRLLQEPFLIRPNVLNKNALSPLWISAWHNRTKLGILLLEQGADPNVQDLQVGYTPLHCAILGYHIGRVDETCGFIDKLLEHGANPLILDKSGESAPHLSIGTLDFKVMSKFIEFLDSPEEILNIRDETGNTIFHYAVGYLDEHSIYNLMLKGADLMVENCTEVIVDQKEYGFGAEQLVKGFQFPNFRTNRSLTIKRIPLQEAIKNGNSHSYFNALMKLNLKEVLDKMGEEKATKLICMHLVAATREVRPDLVRLLFNNQITKNLEELHKILLFRDPSNDDETFTKTALEWAVENNDRLCTTEILHQEYACHQYDRKEGLNCLRRQLTGDELLTWTIETFTMFYSKTWAQSVAFPLLGLIPLFFSISTFVYDYYSDFELSYEYYINAFVEPQGANLTQEDVLKDAHVVSWENLCQGVNSSHYLVPGDMLLNCSKHWLGLGQSNLSHEIQETQINRVFCTDIQRTSEEYRTAFFVNIICISFPIIVFYIMCSREMWDKLIGFEHRVLEHKLLSSKSLSMAKLALRIMLWPMALVCAPFYILIVAAKQVIFKFQHRRAKRKNKYRKQLQKSEYLWGISRTAEAALESCGQLVLQIWLLSSDFNSLSQLTFAQLVDKTYNGVIFFLSFSIKEATDIEKSLGKIFMSLIALVCGVAASYRTLKRGAVKMTNTIFIYCSLTSQIFARMLSFGLFFFSVRNFMPTVPILLCIHFVLVFILKWTFERARHTHGMMALLVAVLNVFASSLVYVRIVPIDKQVHKARKGLYLEDRAQLSPELNLHSTFFMQSLFFVLVFIENILLASWPLIKGQSNRALSCLGHDLLMQNLALICGLCVASWIFHIMYYKYMGHPWTEINGPRFHKNEIRFNLHLCGTEQYLICSCCSNSRCCQMRCKDVTLCDNDRVEEIMIGNEMTDLS